MKIISKITLGTAQLGMKYGIANTIGKPDYYKSMKILKFAWKNKINALDTAPSYGNSEILIGSFIKSISFKDSNRPIIISKLPPIKNDIKLSFEDLYIKIKKKIKNSLNKLNIKKIPIYLIHNPTDIYIKDGIIVKCLNQIKSENLIERIGISVYNPEEVEASLKYKELDVIQAPINLFDHRLINSGLLKKLKEKNYLIFARSIYLQGLFFISPKNLPNNLKSAKIPLIKLRDLCEYYNIEIDKLAFSFVRDIPEIDSLVIGSENIKQVSRNLSLLNYKPLSTNIRNAIVHTFSDLTEKIINPSLWNF